MTKGDDQANGQRDELSGLLNHRYFRDVLNEELVPQARDSGDPLSLVLVDVDNFMSVNDTFGMPAGDAVLAAVSRTLEEALPNTARVARWGGDELCAALPDTRLDDAFTLLEEFRRRVGALEFSEWPRLRLTSSIGLAAYPANGSTDVELVRAADQALYVAKVTGRNKVSLPLADSRMVTKTSYYTATQLERLSELAKKVKRNEATLLREGLDDLLKKYNDMLGAPPRG